MEQNLTEQEINDIAKREDGPHGWTPGRYVTNGKDRLCLERPFRVEYRRGNAVVYWLAQGDMYRDPLKTVTRGVGWELATAVLE